MNQKTILKKAKDKKLKSICEKICMMTICFHSVSSYSSTGEETTTGSKLDLEAPSLVVLKEVNPLSRGARIVQQALREKDIDYIVTEFTESTRTAQEAATTIGCDLGQIVKSLIFKTKETQKSVLILASGSNRVKESIISNLIGEKIIKADADFVREVTGFAIGGVPPLGHHQSINHIFMDEDLLSYEKVWAAAGTPYALFEIHPASLVEITNATLVNIKNA